MAAWKDGSRFNCAHGVKWGTGPKIYKGSKSDTDWNKDLLWKLYVQQEAHKHKVKIRMPEQHGKDAVESMPPIMMSLEAAKMKGVDNVKFYDPYQSNPMKSDHTDERAPHHKHPPGVYDRTVLRSGQPNNGRDGFLRASGRASSSRGSLRSAGGRALTSPESARSRVSQRPGSDVSSRTLQRLNQLEKMVMQEQQARRSLAAELQRERDARQQAERKLMSVTGGKVQAYEKVFERLQTALSHKGR